jgi:hypothetical protein
MKIEPDLPEGITFNNKQENEVNLYLVTEKINSTKCPLCDVYFESILLTNNGRHEGVIKSFPTENIIWKNALPKDRVRSIKMLDENLVVRLDKHKERHKND